MITLANPNIETTIELESDRVNIIIIENAHEYFKVVSSMISAMQGEESNFTFWENNDKIQASKCGELLLNNFSFDFADKKIITLLYKKLQIEFNNGDFLLSFNKINAEIGAFLQNLFMQIDFSLDYSELNIEDLLKACSVKPAKEYESLLDKIVSYINIFLELKSIKFFVFIGLKDVLSDDDLTLLYRHCEMQKVSLLLFESSKKRDLLPQEKAIIITEDLCEIVENYN